MKTKQRNLTFGASLPDKKSNSSIKYAITLTVKLTGERLILTYGHTTNAICTPITVNQINISQIQRRQLAIQKIIILRSIHSIRYPISYVHDKLIGLSIYK